MRKHSVTKITLAVVTLSFLSFVAGAEVLPNRGLVEVGHEHVQLDVGFWGARLNAHHERTIPHALDCLEAVDNPKVNVLNVALPQSLLSVRCRFSRWKRNNISR